MNWRMMSDVVGHPLPHLLQRLLQLVVVVVGDACPSSSVLVQRNGSGRRIGTHLVVVVDGDHNQGERIRAETRYEAVPPDGHSGHHLKRIRVVQAIDIIYKAQQHSTFKGQLL